MSKEQHRTDRGVSRAVGAVLAAWLAMGGVATWGFWQQARIEADRCAHDRQVRAEVESILVDTFDDLGDEFGADPARIDMFTDRISDRYADLPDPC